MKGELFLQVLLFVERAVVVIAAILAFFPLYQYYSEAEDRSRERIIREAELVHTCSEEAGKYKRLIDIQNSEKAPGLGRYLRNLPKVQITLLAKCKDLDLLSEIDQRTYNEIMEILSEKNSKADLHTVGIG